MPSPPRRWCSFLCLLCSLAPGAASAAYLDELIARSRELRLSERREWHRLMH